MQRWGMPAWWRLFAVDEVKRPWNGTEVGTDDRVGHEDKVEDGILSSNRI